MTEFQELIKDAPKFDLMERGELVAYAYAMYAAGTKADAENAKLRQLVESIIDRSFRTADKMDCLDKENAKLRKLAHLVAEYVSVDQCESCVTKRACIAGELDMCSIRKAILEKLSELGIEVNE